MQLRPNPGFARIETVMIPLVLIALTAAWFSHQIDSKIQASEEAAVHSLLTIAQAQRQIHALESIDADCDGLPEYGWFRELAGVSPLRTDGDGDGVADMLSQRLAQPAVLGEEFGKVDEFGHVVHGGYVFAMLLPGENGKFLTEPLMGETGAVSSELANRYWGCIAWPLRYGETGRRTFYINQAGDIVTTDNASYTGQGQAPLPWAPLRKGRFGMRDAAVHPDACNDGGAWRVVF